MNRPAIPVLVLVPLLAGLERFCRFASVPMWQARAEDRSDDLGRLLGFIDNAATVGAVVLAIVAAIFMPRVAFVVAGVCAALGMVLGAGFGGHALYFGAVLAGLGAGGLQACGYALCLLALPDTRWRASGIVLVAAAVAVGGRLGHATAPLVERAHGAAIVPLLMAVALLGVTTGAMVVLLRERRAERPPSDARRQAVLAATAMALVMLLASLTVSWCGAYSPPWLVTLALVGVGVAWPLAGRDLSRALAVTVLATTLAGLLSFVPLGFVGSLAGLLFVLAALTPVLALARGLLHQGPRSAALVAAFVLPFADAGRWIGAQVRPGRPGALLALLLLGGAGALLLLRGARFDAWLDDAPVDGT